MKITDLTHTIHEEMPVYPGTAGPKFMPVNSYEKDGFQETLLSMYSHTGTHMDPPAHIFEGKITLDKMPIDQFVGKAVVIECSELAAGQQITMKYIEKQRKEADEAEFILFHTGWDRFWGMEEYFGEYPYITEEVADYLIQNKKKGVGLDVIGLDPVHDENLTLHKKLFMENEMIIVENLTNLDKIGGELFTFVALPLKYRDADGSPIRAIALMEK